MFDSKIGVSALIADLQSEVDIAIPVPDSFYIQSLNALEQMLYSEIIQEQHKAEIQNPESVIVLSEISVDAEQAQIRFEDIYAVYADGVQFIKAPYTSGVIFPDTYYKQENNLAYHTETNPKIIELIYFIRPALKSAENENTGNVMLPAEFLELAKAKMRADAYKIANEDAIAAKWMNDYNVLLETFKAWVQGKSPNFGF